jgi:undecaprenyl-diphosphatase
MLRFLRRVTSSESPFRRISFIIEEISKDLLIVIGLFVISSLLFYFLVHSIIPEKVDIIDNSAFLLFSPYISPVHTRIAMIVTFFGTGTFLIPSYGLIIFYLLRKKFLIYVVMVLVIAVSSLLLGWLLKEMFHRARPLNPLVGGAGGYSFPSGHALGGFIFGGALIWLIWQAKRNVYLKWMLSLFIAAFGTMIGLSRIYLHVHYATDVLGSLFVTFIWYSLLYIFFRLVYKGEKAGRVRSYDPEGTAISENYQFNN